MKLIFIVSIALILLLLTAGCLDDLSSTLPPCCDGTCDGVKTSVITVDCSHLTDPTSSVACYAVDSDGMKYAGCVWSYSDYDNHNVTFSYEMVKGHRHITGIIEDHGAKPTCECECVKKCCGCDE